LGLLDQALAGKLRKGIIISVHFQK